MEARYANVIALAELSSLAGDEQALAIELQQLVTLDTFDVTVTGFEMGEIDLILQSLEKEPPPEMIEADLAGPPVTIACDLWILGDHKVLCADATIPTSYEQLMGQDRARMVFTDPPYNVAVEGHICGKGSIHQREFAIASGEMSSDEFIAFLRTTCNALCAEVDGPPTRAIGAATLSPLGFYRCNSPKAS